MSRSVRLPTARVIETFMEAVVAHGGQVTDIFSKWPVVFIRSVLPHAKEVRPRDVVQGGVALKVKAEGMWLCPYVFRLVCRNGLIMTDVLQARSVDHIATPDASSALESIREGVEACCARHVFAQAVDVLRVAARSIADRETMMMLHGQLGFRLTNVMRLFHRERDRSQFGLANAITAVARDTADPDTRWDLEELGGSIAIGAPLKGPWQRGRLRQHPAHPSSTSHRLHERLRRELEGLREDQQQVAEEVVV